MASSAGPLTQVLLPAGTIVYVEGQAQTTTTPQMVLVRRSALVEQEVTA